MNRNNRWKFLFTVFVVTWCLYSMYPPTGHDLIEYFDAQATARDATFSNIVAQAQSLQKIRPHSLYENLIEATGTNDLQPYFRQFEVKNEPRPNAAILNRLQRKAAGKIRLGLDLQGGTSILVKMDTSSLTNADVGAALSHAVEVLRRRVDKFGVAEPLIQPQGTDSILVQLPGLSAADQENAHHGLRYVVTDTAQPCRIFDVTLPPVFNDLQRLDFGQGYWILAKDSVIWQVGGGATARPAHAAHFGHPPATFYGLLNSGAGFTPMVGMVIAAWVDGQLCGQGETIAYVGAIWYRIHVFADGPQPNGCGANGRSVAFRIDGQVMLPFGAWSSDQVWRLDLAPAQRVFLPLIRK